MANSTGSPTQAQGKKDASSKLAPQPDLLVFKKKEIILILVLFGLIALFSFTLGVRLGRGINETSGHSDHSQKSLEDGIAEHQEKSDVAPAHSEHQEGDKSADSGHGETDAHSDESNAVHHPAPSRSTSPEDKIDQELSHEV